MLWLNTSGGLSARMSSARSMRPLPRKSGVRISMRVFGELVRIAEMQSTKCCAPPSRRSSRSTLVTTTYFRPMSATVMARLAGSFASGGFGRPCATSQNEQRRVHTSPKIMKVAVPWLKHSWMFGQLASSQTVTKRFFAQLGLEVLHGIAGRNPHADPRRLAQYRRIDELHWRAMDLVATDLLDAGLQRRRRGGVAGDDLQGGWNGR